MSSTGYIDIFKNLIDTYDIDGFRLDTAKHVNIELWQELAQEVIDYAQAQGKPDFTMFGEVFSGDPTITSLYTTEGTLPSVLDFGLQETVGSVGIFGGPTNNLRDLFAKDDYYTDADSNAYQLATFVSNHDRGRAGYLLAPGAARRVRRRAGAADAMGLRHALLRPRLPSGLLRRRAGLRRRR